MGKVNGNWISIGKLANLCGVSVRTLQYYDKCGLLHASLTDGGRRVYSREDLLVLQQILFLKSLGFPLNEIGKKILPESSNSNLEKIFIRQREILSKQIEGLQKIVDVLDIAVDDARHGREISFIKLMSILGLMKEGQPYTFIMLYFSDEQFKNIAERFNHSDIYEAFANKASLLFARLEELSKQNVDPKGKEGQEFARRWWEMVCEFAAGNREMLHTLISSGRDMANWPKEAEHLRELMEKFLSPALDEYFRRNGISIDEGVI
ncbi:MerR family transcriptional regulator [Caproicibacterium sp. NSD3]